MYILSSVTETEPKYIRYTLRNENQQFTIQIYEDHGVITHQPFISPVAFNFTSDAGEDLTPDAAMGILDKLITHLESRNELLNLSDYKPNTE